MSTTSAMSKKWSTEFIRLIDRVIVPGDDSLPQMQEMKKE
jgi:hypothetical protein